MRVPIVISGIFLNSGVLESLGCFIKGSRVSSWLTFTALGLKVIYVPEAAHHPLRGLGFGV